MSADATNTPTARRSGASGTGGGRLVGARRRRRTQLIIISFIGFTAAAAIAFSLIGLDRFMLPSDFYERYDAGELKPGRTLRIGGQVATGSVEHGEDAAVLFTITDTLQEIRVVYQGVLPDLFREGQGVVADGIWEGGRDDGVLRAERVLAKHDENYNPPQLEEALKERGITLDHGGS